MLAGSIYRRPASPVFAYSLIPMKNRTFTPWKRAFSLVELLVVVAVIAIVAGFAVPAVTTMVRGSQLSQSSQLLSDQVALCRQLALSRNRPMQIRFYKFADTETPGEVADTPDSGAFRAFQIFEVFENGAAVPVNKIQRLPNNVIINEGKFSTIIQKECQRPRIGKGQTSDLKDSDPEMPDTSVKKNYYYMAVLFKPDGSTDLPTLGTPVGSPTVGDRWYITLHGTNEKGNGAADIPKNYFTMQIDPVTGTTRSYRPQIQ